MRKIIFLFAVICAMSCGVKQTRTMVESGDYDAAVTKAVRKLQGDKDAKGKQEYVYLLEEAFAKAKERDTQDIAMWFKDGKPSDLERIYNAYVKLNARQQQVKPLLPLKLIKENRAANFAFEDYSDQIISSKNVLSKYLYTNSKALVMTNDKMGNRRAYDDLKYLNGINPNFKDVSQLMQEAQNKGTDFVNVYAKNQTGMMIPYRLQEEIGRAHV